MVRTHRPNPAAIGLAVAVALSSAAPAARAGDDEKFVPAKFANLRFEEDWSHLADEDVRTNHAFPDIKHVDMGGGWTASFGGQVRLRTMQESNKGLMDANPRVNDFNLVRTRLHGDFRHESGVRVFVEALDARIHGHDRPPTPIDRNDVAVQNAFVELAGDGVAFRYGRMELQEGAQRLISPLDWANTRRTFDGALWRIEGGGVRTDLFYAQPVMPVPRADDIRDGSRTFAGVYTSIKTDAGPTVDLFGLVLDEDDPLFMGGDGTMGDMSMYTLGGRAAGKHGNTDWELWGARQTGDRSSDDIEAYAYEAGVGQTFPDAPGQPRVGIEVLYASGDDDPTDGDYQTFNQLYPLGHAYLGYLDLVGRQNIIDTTPSVTVKLGEDTTGRVAYHIFKLAEAEDALYNAGGGATFADPTGAADRDVGREVDLTLAWVPPFLKPHGHVLVGWSHFMPGGHIEDLGGDGDADLFYVQFTTTF